MPGNNSVQITGIVRRTRGASLPLGTMKLISYKSRISPTPPVVGVFTWVLPGVRFSGCSTDGSTQVWLAPVSISART